MVGCEGRLILLGWVDELLMLGWVNEVLLLGRVNKVLLLGQVNKVLMLGWVVEVLLLERSIWLFRHVKELSFDTLESRSLDDEEEIEQIAERD